MSAASLVTLAKAHDPQWLVLQKAVVKWTLGSRSERVCARWLRYLSFYTEYDPNAPRKAITMTDIPNPNETNCEWLRFAFDIHPYGELSGLQIDSRSVGAIAAAVLMRMIETNERGEPGVPTTTLVKSFNWHRGRTLRAPA